MNFFELISNVWLTKSSNPLNSWNDLDIFLHSKYALEVNNSLQDIWLNYSSLFRERDISLTCVIGQYKYDMPFNGKIKQDGLLIQPMSINSLNQKCDYYPLKYNINSERFFESLYQGQPNTYHLYNDQLLLKPIPDKAYSMKCLYYCRDWAISQTTINQVSNSGQNILNVANTNATNINGDILPIFKIGDIIYINRGTSTEETGVIESIQDDVSLTFIGNLTFTHNINEKVIVERQELKFETDEPNIPKEYHNSITYMTLVTLFYGDVRQNIYIDKLRKSLTNMINDSKNSQEGTEGIRITNTEW
jgi:hypothetical protein